jgi:hypothetical protein
MVSKSVRERSKRTKEVVEGDRSAEEPLLSKRASSAPPTTRSSSFAGPSSIVEILTGFSSIRRALSWDLAGPLSTPETGLWHPASHTAWPLSFLLRGGGLLGCVAEQYGATANTVNQKGTTYPRSQVTVTAVPSLLCCPGHPCVLLTMY